MYTFSTAQVFYITKPNVTKSKHKPQQNKIQTAQDAKRNNKKKQAC
jgi:hypothetical protein